MKLFGKKKPEAQESIYEIFGGAAVRKSEGGYEVAWKGAHPMVVKFSSLPEIGEGVKIEEKGDTLIIISSQCKLRIVTRDGEMTASISVL